MGEYNLGFRTIQKPNVLNEDGNRSEPLRLPRDILELDIFKDLWKLGAFIDLLRLANTRQSRISWRDRQKEQKLNLWEYWEIRFLRKSEFVQSFRYLCDRWRISSNRLYSFLSELEENNLIKIIAIEDQEEEARDFTEWEKDHKVIMKAAENIKYNYSGKYERTLYKIMFDFFVDETQIETQIDLENQGQSDNLWNTD